MASLGAEPRAVHRKRRGSEVPVELLAKALEVYAMGASTEAAGKAGSADILAVDLLVETLLPVAPGLRGHSEGRVVTKATKAAMAALGPVPSAISNKLDRLLEALS